MLLRKRQLLPASDGPRRDPFEFVFPLCPESPPGRKRASGSASDSVWFVSFHASQTRRSLGPGQKPAQRRWLVLWHKFSFLVTAMPE